MEANHTPRVMLPLPPKAVASGAVQEAVAGGMGSEEVDWTTPKSKAAGGGGGCWTTATTAKQLPAPPQPKAPEQGEVLAPPPPGPPLPNGADWPGKLPGYSPKGSGKGCMGGKDVAQAAPPMAWSGPLPPRPPLPFPRGIRAPGAE